MKVAFVALLVLCCTAFAWSEDTATTQLLHDNPDYNKPVPLAVPILEVSLTNGVIWAFDRYVGEYHFARISSDSIKHNFDSGFHWDTDDFETNFSLHPYSGSAYYNCARSNGYGFYQSVPFAFGGSLMWEMLGETTRPSYNDLINTTVSGIFLGEVMYRLSSSVLDDQSTGAPRVFREIAATLINPVRGFNRILQGKMFRVTEQEVYQKEPLSMMVAAGVRHTRNSSAPVPENNHSIVNLNLTYGNPFEVRSRKPFDYFTLHADLTSGDVQHIATNVIGEGFLLGGTSSSARMMTGLFQHYDYWNTDTFEIGTLGIGGSWLSRIQFDGDSDFQNEFHLAVVPLGASNQRKIVVDTTNPNFQNYTYAGGAQLKYQTSLTWHRFSFLAQYYLYWLHTYVGPSGNDLIGILRPRIAFRVYRGIGISYESFLYHRTSTNPNGGTIRNHTTEQRVYLLLGFESSPSNR